MPSFKTGMKLFKGFAEESPVEMRIDLRSGNAGVPEHFLNRPKVRAAFDEMGVE